MNSKSILNKTPLGFNWSTRDPFIYCVHHKDHYPQGNAQLGPNASLAGRYLGNDFTLKDGWRMYHGETVPGFPAHPHRGFETITIVLNGFVDHSDSLGAAGRYGNGDVQWMTAGKGIQHSEMFPLLNQNETNLTELFQIWLNLPKSKKFSNPFYKMFWAEDIPKYFEKGKEGNDVEILVIAGKIGKVEAISPPPDSWAFDKSNDVNIWLIKLNPFAQFNIPASTVGLNRFLYFYIGDEITIDEEKIESYHSVELISNKEIGITNGASVSNLLFLQAKPIQEPVVQHGPFVMNTQEEIQQTFDDYRATQFGGWPWQRYDNVHGSEKKRFARYDDGTMEEK